VVIAVEGVSQILNHLLFAKQTPSILHHPNNLQQTAMASETWAKIRYEVSLIRKKIITKVYVAANGIKRQLKRD
jgi:hypothetical protein